MKNLPCVNKTGSAAGKTSAVLLALRAIGLSLAWLWLPIGAQDAGADVLSTISNMTVAQQAYGARAGQVSLNWSNGTRYNSLSLFIDDLEEPVAVLDGELNEYTAADISNGEHVFGLRGQSGDLFSELVTVSFTVRESTPLGDPAAGISCSYFPGGGGTIEVSWTPGEDNWSTGVLQLGDGETIEIASGADSVTAEGVGPEVPEFAIFFINAEGYYSDRIVPVCALRPALFLRGDCNSDGGVNVSDAIFELNHLYLGRERWYCDDACDANDDGRTNLSDAVTIINYIFFGQIEPIGMERTCRPDETEDFLGGICECPF